MRVNWITLRIKDVEASKAFYGDLLQMEMFREFTGSDGRKFAFFRAANGLEIELVQNNKVGDRGLVNDQFSIGISVPDYERVVAECREKGFLTEEPAPHVGKLEYVFVQEPDGTALQICRDSDI